MHKLLEVALLENADDDVDNFSDKKLIYIFMVAKNSKPITKTKAKV